MNSLVVNEFLTGETAASAFFLYLYFYAPHRELSWQLSKFWVCSKLYSFNLISVWKHISHTGIKWKKSPFALISNLTYQTCVCVLVSFMRFFRITWCILLQSVEGHIIPIIIYERNLNINHSIKKLCMSLTLSCDHRTAFVRKEVRGLCCVFRVTCSVTINYW